MNPYTRDDMLRTGAEGEADGAAAQTRSRGYALLADWAAYGLTPQMLPALRAVGALGPLLPAVWDADAAASAQQQVFGRSLFACQSFFLDEAGQRGGAEAERVQAAYASMGFAPSLALEPDSLACELAALAFLCGVEADARAGGAPLAERAAQAHLLAQHLLRWLPPLCEVLRRQPFPLYAAMAELLWAFVGDHAAQFGARLPPPPAFIPAPPPDALAPNTSLRMLVAWLIAPACAGFLITHDDLREAAAAASLPTGFGDRRMTLMHLLRTAGEYDALALLLDALQARAEQASAACVMLAEGAPVLAPWLGVWQARTEQTQRLLETMRRSAPPA